MKKIIIATIILIIGLLLFYQTAAFAVEEKNVMETNTANDLIKIKDKTKGDLDEYTRKYGSESYGTTAYILNKIRIYSIPLCFVGVAIGALYQYVLGTRRLDMRHRGFALIIASITILVICQVLPLVFAIVVRGWRG